MARTIPITVAVSRWLSVSPPHQVAGFYLISFYLRETIPLGAVGKKVKHDGTGDTRHCKKPTRAAAFEIT